mmetsp:Transcript_3657/g.8953  ORF Transcript_3657/g.8953 Transcript_3657/m.8953 type:complete len:228 (-) Transcript_3657:255-938(-)
MSCSSSLADRSPSLLASAASASPRLSDWRSLLRACASKPWVNRFVINELNLFFTAFSARPGKPLAISDHLFPTLCWASSNMASSSGVQSDFTTRLSKWLSHLSRHCFPALPGMWDAISAQRFGPNLATNCLRRLSSSGSQGPLTAAWRTAASHLAWQSSGVLFCGPPFIGGNKCLATFDQSPVPNLKTPSLSTASSSSVQGSAQFCVGRSFVAGVGGKKRRGAAAGA